MQKLLKSLGPVTAIIGAQWGDEGKGKATDILGQHYDVIARACGGANAGHTILVNGKKHVFRLLPSGCLHDGKPVILGSGMVIHLPTLLEEISLLKDAGIDLVPRLKISAGAHIVLEYHKQIDGALEERRAKSIGTTRRGIGPAYMEKAARTGIRMGSITRDLRPDLEEHAKLVKDMYGIDVDINLELKSVADAKAVVAGCLVDSLPSLMKEILAAKKTVLIEGAQATLLDIDHGTYPYVTSSSTTAAGALQGLGLAPNILSSCIGVAKAYCTRVGAGDFPTEETGERGDKMRERGGEFGSVTGRPRRCGWLHLPDIAYSTFINGFTHINLTKLDVLDEEADIPVGIGNNADGTAKFEVLKGWKTSTHGITSLQELPKEAQALILFIEKTTGVPVSIIGTGQDRKHMIIR
jgi:adenylosuccinate synthase